jgi:oligoribonuclease NrnB/cAMP/cGMP phosphodiesterase (DHH superfamily)
MSKKNKLDSLIQTHAQVESPRTLDQVWGDTGESKYKTLDLTEYQKYLKELTKSDLQAHAIKVGLIPIDNREVLAKRLEKEFNKHVSLYRPAPKTKNDIKLSKTAKDILAEGR